MTEEQYNTLINRIQMVLDNQTILDNKLNGIQRQQKETQSDVVVVINNQRILGRDQDKLIEEVDSIKRQLKK